MDYPFIKSVALDFAIWIGEITELYPFCTTNEIGLVFNRGLRLCFNEYAHLLPAVAYQNGLSKESWTCWTGRILEAELAKDNFNVVDLAQPEMREWLRFAHSIYTNPNNPSAPGVREQTNVFELIVEVDSSYNFLRTIESADQIHVSPQTRRTRMFATSRYNAKEIFAKEMVAANISSNHKLPIFASYGHTGMAILPLDTFSNNLKGFIVIIEPYAGSSGFIGHTKNLVEVLRDKLIKKEQE